MKYKITVVEVIPPVGDSKYSSVVDIYTQTVEILNLAEIIKAVNNLPTFRVNVCY